MEKKNVLQYILAGIIIIGFITLTVVLFIPAIQTDLPKWVADNMSAVFSVWIIQFTTVVQYFFGSSKGSSDKTNMIGKK